MMNNQSLFDTTQEFSLQMEDFLQSPYGLSSDILPADDGLGGWFGAEEEDPFGGLKSSGSFLQPTDVDDLLLESAGGPLNEEWMEIVDFNFLNHVPSVESKPRVQLKPQAAKYKTPGVQVKVVKSEPPEQEGSAFELLKSLLTGAASFHQSPAVSFQQTPPESPEPQVAPQLQSPLGSVGSPLGSPESDAFEVQLSSPISEVVEFQQEIPIPSPVFEIVEVEPEIPLQAVIECDNSILLEAEDFVLQSPLSSLSSDDIDSILLSGPSSPSDYLQTIDQSQIDDSSFSVSFTVENGKSRKQCKQLYSVDPEYKPCMLLKTLNRADLDESESSQDSTSSDQTYTPQNRSVTTKKSRPAPYVLDSEYLPAGDTSHLSRKEKKRMQNKNAATRYRLKKREQKTHLMTDEEILQKKNNELRDKVDTLDREIKYMKDLMEEIYKVKAAKV